MAKALQENPLHPAGKQTRIALVEDRRKVREHWVALLDSLDGFQCVGSSVSGEDALTELPALKPDIILMDIFLPGMSGIDCTFKIKELLPNCRVLILTASDDEEMVFPALEAGADGYLLKHSSPESLEHALMDVIKGGVPMTSGIARRVAEYFRKRSEKIPLDQQFKLSQRENEVLSLLSKGYVNKEIADKLSLSVETIRSYLKNIYEKMHVHSRAEAVAKYLTGKNHR